MKDTIIILPVILSFLICLFILPFWIRKAKQIGLIWNDMNKIKSAKVAGSGGIIVVFAFIISSLLFVAYRTFYLKDYSHTIEIFAILLVISLLSGIGLVDDLLGWQRGGLSKRSRIAMVILSSIPLVVINAGKDTVFLPFVGQTNLGLFYALLLIPIGISGAAFTYNFLAGFNGLEAGQGIILLSAMSFVSYHTGNPWLSIISLCMAAGLFAFLLFNFSPAQVFPGNSITLSVGGLIAMISILGNFEKIALFFFIPYILEFILKSRGSLVKQSFGLPNKDGSLDLKYEKLYGLTHVALAFLKGMGVKATEKRVVYTIWIFQIIIIILGIVIFKEGIFFK